jgi:hypothetical protein
MKDQRRHEHQRGCARYESQKLRENESSDVRQAMADITLARTCPSMSMAPVLAIIKVAAAASKVSGSTPLERVVEESRPGRTALNKMFVEGGQC